MTDDSVQALTRTMKDTLALVGETREDVATIKANQVAHAREHKIYQSTRAQTCPNTRLADNIDGLAAIQRDHTERIVVLEDFKRGLENDTQVDAEIESFKMKPIRLLVKYLDKIAAAVLIAAAIKVLVG